MRAQTDTRLGVYSDLERTGNYVLSRFRSNVDNGRTRE
jgi:hypothetical protein